VLCFRRCQLISHDRQVCGRLVWGVAERCGAHLAGGVAVLCFLRHCLVLHSLVEKARWWMLQLQQCMFGGGWEWDFEWWVDGAVAERPAAWQDINARHIIVFLGLRAGCPRLCCSAVCIEPNPLGLVVVCLYMRKALGRWCTGLYVVAVIICCC
jgi:hypothetical protein